jgi:hypothetical protein
VPGDEGELGEVLGEGEEVCLKAVAGGERREEQDLPQRRRGAEFRRGRGTQDPGSQIEPGGAAGEIGARRDENLVREEARQGEEVDESVGRDDGGGVTVSKIDERKEQETRRECQGMQPAVIEMVRELNGSADENGKQG